MRTICAISYSWFSSIEFEHSSLLKKVSKTTKKKIKKSLPQNKKLYFTYSIERTVLCIVFTHPVLTQDILPYPPRNSLPSR